VIDSLFLATLAHSHARGCSATEAELGHGSQAFVQEKRKKLSGGLKRGQSNIAKSLSTVPYNAVVGNAIMF
jgi:hypothetical protein